MLFFIVKTKRHSSTESSRSHKTTSVTHNISIKSADADIRTNSTNNEKYSNENSFKASSTPSIESLSDDNQLVQKKNRKRRSTTDQGIKQRDYSKALLLGTGNNPFNASNNSLFTVLIYLNRFYHSRLTQRRKERLSTFKN